MKPYLLISVVFLSTLAARSQPSRPQSTTSASLSDAFPGIPIKSYKLIHFGLRAAGTLSKMSGDVGTGSRSGRSIGGFSFGGFGNYRLIKWLSVSVEANVSDKGDSYHEEGIINERHFRITLQSRLKYFSIPITLHYRPSIFGKFSVYAGIEPSWLIKARQHIKGTAVPGSPTETDSFRNSDVGIIFGVDYSVNARWSIDLRAIKGVKDLTYPSASTYVTNKSIQFGVKYWFG